jgi:hypothetical protein
LKSGLQGVDDGDSGVNFDGLAVEKSGSVAPLADGFDGGASKVRINLAVHDTERKRLAIHADDGVKDDRALHASRFGGFRVERLDSADEFGGFDRAANTEA